MKMISKRNLMITLSTLLAITTIVLAYFLYTTNNDLNNAEYNLNASMLKIDELEVSNKERSDDTASQISQEYYTLKAKYEKLSNAVTSANKNEVNSQIEYCTAHPDLPANPTTGSPMYSYGKPYEKSTRDNCTQSVLRTFVDTYADKYGF